MTRLASNPLLELARLFLKLGTIGFGGPAAHIALMEDEVVRRRGWLSRERFLDLLGATNLIPGPNSTEMAVHVGKERAGWRGLLVAGACFILPAFLIVLACAWAYERYDTLPAAEGLLRGVKPVVIAIVLQALLGLGRTAARTRALAAIGFLSLAAAAAGVHELIVIFGAGALFALVTWARLGRGGSRANGLLAMPLGTAALAATAAGTAPFGLTSLFLIFLKIGSVLFGSGYVLLAFLRADLVVRRGWLTESQLLDAVAVGQVTPGPVFTTATFVGYVLGGFWGAMVATVGIFLPAFVFVALSGPLVPRIRRSPVAGTFLDGVNVGSIALMAIVTAQLARAAIGDVWTGAVAAASAVLLLRFRASPAWLVPAGGILGLVLPRERAPVIPAGGYGRIFLDWGQVMEPMKILLSLVALVVIALIVVIVWMGSPRGPRLRDVAHLREPRLGTLPPQKVLLVTARGDPNTVGKEAFGQLMRTYFALKGVPKGGPAFKAPRARWPDAGRVPGEWTGLYAMPVPDAVTALPASSAEDGLEVALTTWDYGEVAEILHVGPYSAEEPTIGRLKSFIADQGYEIAGPHEEEYLRGPGMLFAGDPGGYLTLIRYPVRRRAGPSTP